MLVDLENYFKDNASKALFWKVDGKGKEAHIYPSFPVQTELKAYQLLDEVTLHLRETF